jgi:hypothetical protein
VMKSQKPYHVNALAARGSVFSTVCMQMLSRRSRLLCGEAKLVDSTAACSSSNLLYYKARLLVPSVPLQLAHVAGHPQLILPGAEGRPAWRHQPVGAAAQQQAQRGEASVCCNCIPVKNIASGLCTCKPMCSCFRAGQRPGASIQRKRLGVAAATWQHIAAGVQKLAQPSDCLQHTSHTETHQLGSCAPANEPADAVSRASLGLGKATCNNVHMILLVKFHMHMTITPQNVSQEQCDAPTSSICT